VKFTSRVAIQVGTEVRDTAGGVTYTYSDLEGCESLWATVLPVTDEEMQERMTPDEERWNIIIGGHWPQITVAMFVLDADDNRLEINRVQTTKRQRLTIVRARRAST